MTTTDNNNNNNNNNPAGLLGELLPRPDPTRLTTQQLYREITNLRDLLDIRLAAMDKAVVLFNDNLTRVPTDTDKQINHLQSLAWSRLDSLNAILARHQIQIDQVPVLIGERMDALTKISAEKFSSIVTQFEERDLRSKQLDTDNKTAIESAFRSAQRVMEEQAKAAEVQITNLRQLHDEKFRSIQVQFTERDTRTEQTSRDSKVAVDAALQAAKEAVGEQNKSSALAIAKSETSTTKQIDQLAVLIANSSAGLNDKIEDIKSRLTLIEGKSVGNQDKTQSLSSNVGIGLAALAIVVSIFAIYSGTSHQSAGTGGGASLESRLNSLEQRQK